LLCKQQNDYFCRKIQFMETSQQILDLLKYRSKESIEYFGKIALGDMALIKYGFNSTNVSITFLITGKPQKQHLCISKKMQQFIESDKSTDFEPLNNYLLKVKNPVQFHFCPYLKINEQPEMYAFQIGIEHKRN